jgi:hypothetical protein
MPSGNYARLRPVALDVLLSETDNIPNLLLPLAARVVWEESVPGAVEDGKATTDLLAATPQILGLINVVCKAAFMEPRVVNDPQADDEIGLEDIEFDDKMAVWKLCVQPVEVLRGFRDRQAKAARPVRNRQRSKQPAKQPSGDK